MPRNKPFLPYVLTGLAGVAIAMASLALSGCLFGTTSETENTAYPGTVEVQGSILLSGGGPAANARITVRTGKVEVIGGVPTWAPYTVATADSKGRYSLVLPTEKELFLEIRESAGEVVIQADPYPEVYFGRLDSAGPRPAKGTVFRLQPAGTLKGSLVLPPGTASDGLWVGIKGTSAVSRLDGMVGTASGIPFSLEGLAPGNHALTLLSARPVAAWGTTIQQTVDTLRAEVKPESVTGMGTIFYNDPEGIAGPI